jgi:hypothetical protein
MESKFIRFLKGNRWFIVFYIIWSFIHLVFYFSGNMYMGDFWPFSDDGLYDYNFNELFFYLALPLVFFAINKLVGEEIRMKIRKNILLLKISLKFGLILGVLNLIFGIINSLTFNPDNLYEWSYFLTGLAIWVLIYVILVFAHYDFNKKNGNYISFINAIMIGLIILIISNLISSVNYVISYELIMKEKLRYYYFSNLADKLYFFDFNAIYDEEFSLFEYLLNFRKFFFQIIILFQIITLESFWKIYKKAGKEGWASIIPIYNIIVLLEIVKKPTWWTILFFIPFVNLIFSIWVTNLLSKQFNKGVGFTLGLIFLPFIFYPLLGLSKVEYINKFIKDKNVD